MLGLTIAGALGLLSLYPFYLFGQGRRWIKISQEEGGKKAKGLEHNSEMLKRANVYILQNIGDLPGAPKRNTITLIIAVILLISAGLTPIIL